MSLEKSDVIDWLSIDDSGQVLLTITDDLDWDNEAQHLHALQRKLNSYLGAMESGEVYDRAREATGREVSRNAPIRIEIVAPFPWPPPGERFFAYAKGEVADAGFELTFRTFTPREPTST